jgi:hypothetical protein
VLLTVELAGTRSGGERGPLGRGEHQGRAGLIRGAPHGAVRVEVGHLTTPGGQQSRPCCSTRWTAWRISEPSQSPRALR